MEPEAVSGVCGDKVVGAEHGAPPPELIPVKASVFDDDFFRSAQPPRQEAIPEEGRLAQRFAEVTHFSGSGHLQMEDVRVTEEIFPLEASVRAPSYGSGLTAGVENVEPDELDIPAFLRRGN